jgi:NADH-quinone oxidoreductase subunit J
MDGADQKYPKENDTRHLVSRQQAQVSLRSSPKTGLSDRPFIALLSRPTEKSGVHRPWPTRAAGQQFAGSLCISGLGISPARPFSYRKARLAMTLTFYLASTIAIGATGMAITRTNPVHALLYLVVSFLAIALIFFTLGAPFAAVLQVLIYAGAIMVLFIFVVMMLNLGEETARQESRWLTPGVWAGPSLLSVILLVELVYVLTGGSPSRGALAVDGKEVGIALYGPYLLAVELASMLLLAGLVGAYHLGKRERGEEGT